jgi:acyl-CoA dehydrogenase
MSWDFSTEPEFQTQLDWVGDFVRAEIYPLETLDLDWPQLRRAVAPLQTKSRLVGCGPRT